MPATFTPQTVRLFNGNFNELTNVTKIVWGADIPVSATTFRGWDTQKNDYVYEPCIVRKTFSFEICEICGEQLTGERLKNGLGTCSPECGTKKWDSRHGLVITQEREKKGTRPSRFREIIKSECLRRDNYRCRSCGKSGQELLNLMESETGAKEAPDNSGKKSDYLLNVHHIRQIKNGGDNTPANLITLCGRCHKQEHSAVANRKRKHLSLEHFGIGRIDPVAEEG